MGLNISKFAKKPYPNTNKKINIDNVNCINVRATLVHTGKVLTIDEINKNRSSKYTYLAF